MQKLTKKQWKKFASNLLEFTAPALAAFFGQLAMKIDWKPALLFASYILYASARDYFKKMKKK
jgi:hypothetical protein